MRRREFLGALGGGMLAWPFGARAQSAIPAIGFLVSTAAGPVAYLVTAFRRGLKVAGFVEGQNVSIEFRYADNQIERLPALAAELVDRPASVIVAGGGGVTARTVRAATSTIPIVFANGDDPIRSGLVPSLSRPGGNVTGVTFFTIELGPKRLEMLRELVPGAQKIGVLINPKSANAESEASALAVQSAIRANGQQPVLVYAGAEAEFASAFENLKRQQADCLLLVSDPLFTTRRQQIIALAARDRMPAIYPVREFADAGGLVSYGASIADAYRQVGMYTAQILKGARPADLPVVQPTRFELVINLKTAKVLGMTVAREFMLRADELIE
jgi:putative tryptophan/tyrosine transport system substrate-binding protein